MAPSERAAFVLVSGCGNISKCEGSYAPCEIQRFDAVPFTIPSTFYYNPPERAAINAIET